MKTFLASVALLVCCAGCFNTNEVVFLYFNLSPNEIVVDSIAGLPPWASPGVLVPVHAEDQLSTSGMSSTGETIRVPPTLTIVWREGGASHQAELKRDEVGIPAKIKKGKVRFTYLGGDKWRVKVL
jgi:hypothetical protein